MKLLYLLFGNEIFYFMIRIGAMVFLPHPCELGAISVSWVGSYDSYFSFMPNIPLIVSFMSPD
jgi:hypothetical protein